MNEKSFKCPFCNANLLLNSKYSIIIFVKKEDRVGLVLLNPNFGDYSIEKDKGLSLAAGDMLEVYCPICHGSLYSKDKPGLCYLVLDEGFVYFSPIFGEKVTFVEKPEGNYYYGDSYHKYSSLFVGFNLNPMNIEDFNVAIKG